jgi:hypothetical protein
MLSGTSCATYLAYVVRQQVMAAFQQGDREKVRTAGNIGADVVGHTGKCTPKR